MGSNTEKKPRQGRVQAFIEGVNSIYRGEERNIHNRGRTLKRRADSLIPN
jgi:hypothetical protein